MPYLQAILGSSLAVQGDFVMHRISTFCLLYLLASVAVAERPLTVLLTNDDGYLAPGIQALRAALLEAGHTVYLIAPEANQSGSATSITSQGVAYTRHGNQVWSVAGRPADAVRLGLGHIMQDNPPDLVLSGINFGQNVGQDVMVSGTVGAAVTALQLGFPAIATSAEINFSEAATGFSSTLITFAWAAPFIAELIRDPRTRFDHSFLNLNFPTQTKPKGLKQAPLAASSILSVDFKENDSGLWRSGYETNPTDKPGSDRPLLAEGFITITQLGISYEPVPINSADLTWIESRTLDTQVGQSSSVDP